MSLLLLVGGIIAAIALLTWWTKAQSRQAEEATLARNKAEWDRQAEDLDAFLKRAKLVKARILSAQQWGRVNLRPNIQFTLRIESPEGTYEAETTQAIDPTQLHRFGEGSVVDVHVEGRGSRQDDGGSREAPSRGMI
ncbi:MAG TPA: hypothetical protein VMI75_30995 [Polyangiaceae bacterium]|nr:hypothetical protein [Polyangiaceae bacterium]